MVSGSIFSRVIHRKKMNTLLKIYNALRYEWPSVEVDPEIAPKAVKSIQRMLELS